MPVRKLNSRQHALIFPRRTPRPRGPLATKPHASRRQRALPSPPAATQWSHLLLRSQYTAYSARVALPCIVSGDDSAVFRFFVPGDLDLWPPKFELRRDFCTVHLTAKFHHHTFNRSEIVVQTNKRTDKQTDAAENILLISLRYAGG